MIKNISANAVISDGVEERTRIGMLTPSSNTVLEPVTHEIARQVPGLSMHFSRLRVTEIALNQLALAQFDLDPFLGAASLLVDAKCQVIAWSGTSGGWRGFKHDQEICDAIEAQYGVSATTSILAQRDLFEAHGVNEFGLLTPYTSDVQTKIVDNFGAAGFHCLAERHLGISDNYSFANVDDATIWRLCRELADEGAQSIAVICTNVKGAGLATALELELGITLYDSVSVVVLRALQLASVPVDQVHGWGRIFALSS